MTTRFVDMLIDGLPEDSYFARSCNPDTKGTAWTVERDLLWQVSQQLSWLLAWQQANFTGTTRGVDFPDWRRYPWDKPTTKKDTPGRLGRVNEGDEASALEYLAGL